ncbi:hypothetical protein INT48_006325 [Thamnidium elegans]|uniref:CCHC-type domain-containing protein n=1 Tax=Thamnidium elegans TaxID=101142 RepID=A0A8H7VTQ9_9FUNG|nr:hypothetical protein INT48_006325 [Thamnidium elegans]
MEQTTENLNKFEIEERIETALPIGLRKAYQEYRTIKPEDIIERLKSTKKREEHWNSIVQPLVGKYKKELTKQIFTTNNNIMGTENDQNNYVAAAIAEAVKEGISQAISAINMSNNNKQLYPHDLELLNKPSKYNGSRDPFIIDNWITSIQDYKDYKGWGDKQAFKFARTLLCDVAAIWLRNIEMNEDEPIDTWTTLKKRITVGFKPTNSALIFRERLEELHQTSTISQYIQDFLTLKLGIPAMTDDEAVSKFIRHLKNKDARVQLRARNENSIFSFLPPTTSYPTNSHVVDDPMDLSSLRDAIQYINNISNRGFRVSRSGGFRGNTQARPNNSNYSNRETRACFTCGQIGHLQYNCRRVKTVPTSDLKYKNFNPITLMRDKRYCNTIGLDPELATLDKRKEHPLL